MSENSEVLLACGPLRLADLVAKTAKTSLKDAIRVLIAAQVISREFDLTLPEMIPEGYQFDVSRPRPENVAACEQASSLLEKTNAIKGMNALLRFR
jgi:hypothetical protein